MTSSNSNIMNGNSALKRLMNEYKGILYYFKKNYNNIIQQNLL